MHSDLPLTFQQQWLWDLLQEHPNWRSVVSYSFCIRGPLNVELLQKSLDEVVQRHESLRMSLHVAAGKVWQRFNESLACRLDVRRIEGGSAEHVAALARERVESVCDLSCDPLVDPLLRVSLLRLSEQEHWLVLSLHRLIADCASIDQISREIWLEYGRLLEGEASPGSAAPRYGAYASWQWATNDDWRKRHDTYWRQRLSGATPVQWPADPDHSGGKRGDLGKMSAWFDAGLSEQLRAFARKERTLAAAALLSAYSAVLWRWCGQRDFVMPFHVAGRQSEHRAVVGYFSHLLCLRIQFTPDNTLTDVMRHIAAEFFKAMTHTDFGQIAAAAPQLLTGAYFQWITWHEGEERAQRVPESPHPLELTVERVAIRDFGDGLTAIPPGVVAVETTFFDTPRGIFASGVYRDDLFSAATMERFMRDLQVAVRQLVREPSTRIAQFVASLE